MSTTDTIILIYSTFPDRETAEKVGAKLVESRLAACVNILPTMISVYEWEGKPERAEEAVMLVKTREALQSRALDAIRQSHPYDTPALMVLETKGGDSAFFDWIRHQTRI